MPHLRRRLLAAGIHHLGGADMPPGSQGEGSRGFEMTMCDCNQGRLPCTCKPTNNRPAGSDEGFIVSEVTRFKMEFQPEGVVRECVYASDYDATQAELAQLREELAEASRYRNLFDQSEKTLNRVHCMYAKRLLEATGERQTVLIPDEEFVKYFEEIKDLKQRLTAAEQRNAELVELIRDAYDTVGVWNTEILDRIYDALKPTESGASE